MYSPEFLKEMESRLESEREEVRTRLSQMANREDGNYTAKYENLGDDEDSNISEVENMDVNIGIVERLELRLGDIEAALQKISDGTYGVSDSDPDKTISEDRLRANPAARDHI